MFALRRHRLTTVLFALCSLLFMQFAVAGYSCPGFESRVQEIAAMAEAGMPCAESMSMAMDSDEPMLCHAHCQSAQPPAGDASLQVPMLLAVGDVQYFIAPKGAAPPWAVAQAPLLVRTTAPPLSVRNCCFRI